MIHTIDLDFLNLPRAIAVFAVPDDRGITLVECGPHSVTDNLLAGLEAAGLQADAVHTVLLTHIHFDHAGAAWFWAQRGAQVYVHPRGLKHMIDPSRLYGSARQIYGEMMDQLWGEMHPIDPDRIAAVEDRGRLYIGGREWIAHHTPGHASHHIAWQLGDVVFTGDVGGVNIQQGPVVPPCPPPDINIEAWEESIARLRSLEAEAFYLTHFGRVEDTGRVLDGLSGRLQQYVDWIAPHAARGAKAEEVVAAFTEFLEDDLRAHGVTGTQLESYRAANPPYMSAAGLLRYFEKFRQ